jgi:hypothetical protein
VLVVELGVEQLGRDVVGGVVDGDVDLIGVGRFDEVRQVTLFANGGSGTFATWVAHPLGFSSDFGTATQLALVDLDGDGDDDVLFLAGSVGVVENATNGRPNH